MSSYSDNSILANYIAEIYASRISGDITILHDKPFKKELQLLEYEEKDKELVFVFDDDVRIPYGKQLNEDLWPFFSRGFKAAVILYDQKKKQAVSGFTIPIKVKQPKVMIFN